MLQEWLLLLAHAYAADSSLIGSYSVLSLLCRTTAIYNLGQAYKAAPCWRRVYLTPRQTIHVHQQDRSKSTRSDQESTFGCGQLVVQIQIHLPEGYVKQHPELCGPLQEKPTLADQKCQEVTAEIKQEERMCHSYGRLSGTSEVRWYLPWGKSSMTSSTCLIRTSGQSFTKINVPHVLLTIW